MLLVDRILSIEPGSSIVGIKSISGCEPCYAGVADGLPPELYAYPVSLLLESFGQTAAILWLKTLGASGIEDGHVLMLVAARNCRIEASAFPGDVLRHVARIGPAGGDHVIVEGETFVGDRRIATVESMIAVRSPCAALAEAVEPHSTGAVH